MKKILTFVLIISLSGCSLFQKTEMDTIKTENPEISSTEVNSNSDTDQEVMNSSITEASEVESIIVPEPDFKKEAIVNLDLSRCDNLSDDELKADCLDIVRVEILRNASENKDASLCEKLSTEMDKSYCNTLVLPQE